MRSVLSARQLLAALLFAATPGLAQPAPETPPPVTMVPPELVESVEVELPAGVAAPPEGIELELEIDAQGEVVEARVLQSLGEEADAVIEQAARQMRFAPARRGDVPVPARVRFRFAVADPPPAEPPQEPPPADPPPDAAGEAPPVEPPPLAPPEPAEETPAYGATARVDKPAPGAASQVKLRGAELTQVPGTFGEPLRVVATLPGVARSPFGLGFFLVRGASFQNTGFLVDGFPVPLLYHLGAGPAILSSRLVEQLDFYAGGYPVAFGRYSAGIISLRTAPPPTDRVQLELEVDLLRASALAIVPFDGGKGTVAGAFRRSYYELILPLVTDDVSLFYMDYQLRLDYRFSPRVRAFAFFFGSRDSLQAVQPTGAGSTMGSAQTGLRYRFDQLIVGLRWRISERLRLSWTATGGPSGVDFGQESSTSAALGVDTTSLRLGQRVEAIYATGDFWQTTLGVEQSVWINELDGSAPSFGELPGIPAPEYDRETLPLQDRLSELAAAPYLEQVLRPGPFELTAGLRAEYLNYGDVRTWVADPRGVVRYDVTDAVTLKLASGLFAQPPLPYQIVRRYANPELLPTRSWQSSAGAELELPWSLSIDSTVFYNRMWQLVRATGRPEVDDQGNLVTNFFRDDGEGRAYGWEFLLRRRAGSGRGPEQGQDGLFGWLSYTLSRSERFLEGGRAVPFLFDQTHVLNLAMSYGHGDFRYGARFTLATGRPITDARAVADGSNVVYDADEDDYDVNNLGRQVRLPTFHQLDIRIDYLWSWGPVEGSVFLDVINVYNAQNAEGYLYQHDFRRRGQLPGLPLLPTIGVRGVLR